MGAPKRTWFADFKQLAVAARIPQLQQRVT